MAQDKRTIDADLLMKQLTARESLARAAAANEAAYGDRELGKRWLARADQLAEVIVLIDGLAGESVKL